MEESKTTLENLFEIPADIEFPIELNRYLKEKLHGCLQENINLRRHIKYLDSEVIDLRRYKNDHQEACKTKCSDCTKDNNSPPLQAEFEDAELTTPLLATRIVKLSKQNRDMTAKIESMKTKLNTLSRENDKLKASSKQIDSEKSGSQTTDGSSTNASSTKEGKDLNKQLAEATSKVIEYRRQTQQAKQDLKIALKCLSQETGENFTVQSLQAISHSNWKGRQQCILNLQQRINCLQEKIHSMRQRKSCFIGNSDESGAGDVAKQTDEDYFLGLPKGGGQNLLALPAIFSDGYDKTKGDDSHSIVSEECFSTTNSVCSRPQRYLAIQDKKKQERIKGLEVELNEAKKKLEETKADLSACKARIHNLELQQKSSKAQIQALESQLANAENAKNTAMNEAYHAKDELSIVKERERKHRDRNAIELQEAHRALVKERAAISSLQKVVSEKQNLLQTMDKEICDLKSKLSTCSSNVGGTTVIERIQNMENEIQLRDHAISIGEQERNKLMNLIKQAIEENKDQLKKFSATQNHIYRLEAVLEEATKCIDNCVEASHITDANLLRNVEDVKFMIKESKTGDLHSFRGKNGMTEKMLRAKVGQLSKECSTLQGQLHTLQGLRRKELDEYKDLSDGLKSEYERLMSKAKESFCT